SNPLLSLSLSLSQTLVPLHLPHSFPFPPPQAIPTLPEAASNNPVCQRARVLHWPLRFPQRPPQEDEDSPSPPQTLTPTLTPPPFDLSVVVVLRRHGFIPSPPSPPSRWSGATPSSLTPTPALLLPLCPALPNRARLRPPPPRAGAPAHHRGVNIPHDHGCKAHSDGDVLLHCVVEAIWGALGLPDIGQIFPDSDPKWKGVASSVFLREA
ncbi:2-C-methyl-D-erythritol 2,4-cyclodiphosphate synthase, chloroplastic, partial [Ananas comosus]